MNALIRWTTLTLAILVAAGTARAQLYLDVTRGNVDPLPIAIPEFDGGGDPTAERIGRDIAAVVTNNLERSGLFAPIDPKAFLSEPGDFFVRPDFADWRVINAQALLVGRSLINDDGRLQVQFRLWDVFGSEQLLGEERFSLPEEWRRIAYQISDLIYERLTGEAGYFDSRIVYVAESGPRDKRRKWLEIMYQDGYGPSQLTDGEDLVLTPRFSPNQQQIIYMSYERVIPGRIAPQVFLHDVQTGNREILGVFEGMTFAPRFTPNGDGVIMSLERDGNSDVYHMDLDRRILTRLTFSPAIDTSPSMSPDGEYVTFSSDRSGTPQIYVMRKDGSELQRITFGEGRYNTPVWSPRGDLIAFTRQHQGSFFIGVIRPDGLGERLLTESWLDEGPTWSPNGRVVMFCRQYPTYREDKPGGAALFSVDLTGFNLRKVRTTTDACDPAWSPLIR